MRSQHTLTCMMEFLAIMIIHKTMSMKNRLEPLNFKSLSMMRVLAKFVPKELL